LCGGCENSRLFFVLFEMVISHKDTQGTGVLFWRNLTTKAVQSTTLSLQRIDDVHRRDGLATSVLGVGDGVTNDVLEEHLQHTASLFVNQV
jgi:hypothetical protein